MPGDQDRKKLDKAQPITAIPKQLFNDRDQAKQRLKSAQRGRKMEDQITKDKTACGATAQVLKKKQEAAEREAAAMREAIRHDMALQKALIERYGYGRYRPPSPGNETEEIELSPFRERESNEMAFEENQQGQLNKCDIKEREDLTDNEGESPRYPESRFRDA